MYIEPVHPVYNSRTITSFVFESEKTDTNSFGEKERYFEVIDAFENKIMVPVMSDLETPKVGDLVKMYISRILKGKPVLFVASEFHKTLNLIVNHRYLFRIVGLSTIHNKDYYRLKDQDGGFHFLKLKHFSHRDYSIGDNLFCTIVSEPNPGTYYLEPDYPNHRIGAIYNFTYKSVDRHYYPDGSTEDVVVVTDSNNKDCTLFVEWHKFVEKTILEAKVEYIRKGRLFLRITE